MKLLLTVDSFARGGAGHVIRQLAENLAARGNEVRVLLLHDAEKYEPDNFRVSNIYVAGIESPTRAGRIIRAVRLIREFIDSYGPDAVISSNDNFNTMICFAMRKNSIPLAVREASDPRFLKPAPVWRLLRRAAYRRADRIVVLCEAFRGFLGRAADRKTAVIPNPVVIPPTCKSGYAAGSPLRLVTAARLHPVKDIPFMLETMKLLRGRLDCVLEIWGDGELYETLSSRIRGEGLQDSVFLRGHTRRLPEKLASSDIFLLSSLSEGFPNALCEAMSLGLPCVVRLCHESLREIASENESAVFVKTPGEMADAVLALSASPDLREKLGKNARLAVGRFDIDSVCDSWLGLFGPES